MNGITFTSLVRDIYTKSNTTTLSNALLVTYANVAMEYIVQEAEKVNSGFFTVEQKTDLVLNQRRYALPVNMLNRLEKVALKFPDWTEWQMAEEVLLSMQPWPMDETTIQARYSDMYPRFLLRSNEIILLTGSAIPAATAALDLWAKMYPSAWTVTTLSQAADLSVPPSSTGVGIPRQLHEILARRISIMYKQSRDRPIPLTESEQLFDVDLQKAINAMASENVSQDIVAQLPYYSEETGFDAGLPGRYPFT